MTLVPARTLVALLALTFGAITIMSWLSPLEAYPGAVRRACKSDYKRLCPHYSVGSAKMRSCMRSKVGQISPRCYDKLVDYGYGRRGRRR